MARPTAGNAISAPELPPVRAGMANPLTGGRASPGVVGGWTVHDERSRWRSDWLQVFTAEVSMPSGQRFSRDVVRARFDHTGCLVVNEAGQVMLVWRHRFVTDRWGWELPSGEVLRGADAIRAMACRVEADCGWRIHSPELVWSLPQSPDLIDRIEHLVWASADRCVRAPDPDAVAQVGWFDTNDLRDILRDSVQDTFTMAGLMWLLARSLPTGISDDQS